MATITRNNRRLVEYPTSDGRPIAETDFHRDLMVDLIQTLEDWYQDEPQIYVSGNLLVFYEEGKPRKHVSPDVFVVRGVPKRKRNHYLIWQEGKGLDAAIEITSKSTRKEDIVGKFQLYRATLRVPEYFLFDPFGEYLDPPLRGYRLRAGDYVSIRPVDGRIPSKVLGLHLELDGSQLRLFDPYTGRRLPTPREEKQNALEEIERLRRELDQVRRGPRQP